ncbi:hypothetical protein D3C81_1391070 [compost metagenome]
MAQRVLGVAQGELARPAAQLGALAVGGEQAAVVLDDGAELAGVEQGADRHAGLFQLAAQFGHVQAGDRIALAALDVVVQREGLLHQAIGDALAVAGGGQHRLAQLVVHAPVFVDDEALLGGQVPALEAVAGGRHHAAGVFAVEHRHQALQGGLAGGVGAADVGVVIHDQFHHALQVGVDQDDAVKAGHGDPFYATKRGRGAV